MEIRNLRNAELRDLEHARFVSFALRVSGMAFLFAAGCGAPGVPVPPTPPVPVAVTDLTARQAGDGVQLILTLPTKTITGDRLASPPAVEIIRGTPKPDGSLDAKSLRIVYTIPGSLMANYVAEGHVKIIDPVAPAETRAHPGETLVYVIRTRASQKRASADSNAVSVRVYPVPEPIAKLEATRYRARD